MFPVAQRALVDSGLIPRSATLSFNAHYAAGIAIEVFTDAGEFFVIKLASRSDLEVEFEALKFAYHNFPEFVTEPLATLDTRLGRALILRGAEHIPFSERTVRRNRMRVGRALTQFVATADSKCRLTDSMPGPSHQLAFDRNDWLREGLAACQGSGIRRATDSAAAKTLWSALPRVRQHGDFSCNNIGITDSGIVVFDWEDFGAIDVPGLDLSVLLSSVADFDAQGMVAILDTNRLPGVSTAVSEFCRIYGMTRTQFKTLLPFYITCFLGLKIRGQYGAAVIGKLRTEIEALCQIVR